MQKWDSKTEYQSEYWQWRSFCQIQKAVWVECFASSSNELNRFYDAMKW